MLEATVSPCIRRTKEKTRTGQFAADLSLPAILLSPCNSHKILSKSNIAIYKFSFFFLAWKLQWALELLLLPPLSLHVKLSVLLEWGATTRVARWGKFGMLWDREEWAHCLQQSPRFAAPVVTHPSGLEPPLSPAKAESRAGNPSCSASPAEGERDGACLHSKVHSSQGKYSNYLKWVVDCSNNWGLLSQCYCHMSADPLEQSAQCPRSQQSFKTIEKQHPMEAISFLF